MNRHSFWGIYAPYIEQHIALKRGLGFKYNTAETIYAIFDRFTIERGETVVGISKELAEKWCERKNNESDSYRYHRGVCLSQLSSYLCTIGIRSFIPRLQKWIPTFTPYVFSQREISAIFCASDRLRIQRKSMKSMLFAMPALIRLLYSTGLRIGEAVALQERDVNLLENYLVIKDSKNGKQRMIPISETLSIVLKDYVYHRDLLPLHTRNSVFFVSLNGSPCTSDTVYRLFREILQMANIPYMGNHHGPRVHDLRHTFAVNSLAMMARNGVDMYCTLPILSTYLGHQTLSATDSYVRLTAEMHPELLKEIDMIYLNVFPVNTPTL